MKGCWDIYRSQAQLEALVDPSVAGDTAQSMLDDYAQGGLLPTWDLDNSENQTMVGDPADPIIADYYAFGAHNVDTATALTDMVAEDSNTNDNPPGVHYLTSTGYMPHDSTWTCCNFYGPASTTLEYNTAGFAVSAIAGALGNTSTQTTFANRAQDWRNVLNPNSGFDEPRNRAERPQPNAYRRHDHGPPSSGSRICQLSLNCCAGVPLQV